MALAEVANWALPLNSQQLNIWQMDLEAAVIYIAALVIVRIAGDRRFIGKYVAFDDYFGSTLSQAMKGSS